jgi:phosphate starvation-inducible protein PhoH
MRALSRTQIKKLKKTGQVKDETELRSRVKTTGLLLKNIRPSTDTQYSAFNSYRGGQNLLLHGLPGTGKTFISLYLALESVLNGYQYDRVIIIRSVVPTRDMGFLPGNQKEKSKVYETPYYNICNELFERGDAYDNLKNRGTVEFMTTSFVRGITLNNCIVVVDEVNNMTFHELDSLITRMGDNARLIMCGDFRQSDLKFQDEKRGLHDFMSILKRLEGFDHIEFNVDDIVRSGLVRQYIINKAEMGFV